MSFGVRQFSAGARSESPNTVRLSAAMTVRPSFCTATTMDMGGGGSFLYSRRELAQLAEQLTLNQRVVGSSPTLKYRYWVVSYPDSCGRCHLRVTGHS